MNRFKYYFLFVLSLITIISCSDHSTKPSSDDLFSDEFLVVPKTISQNEKLPIVYRTIGNQYKPSLTIPLTFENASSSQDFIVMKKGTGAWNFDISTNQNFEILCEQINSNKMIQYVENPIVEEVSGLLSENHIIWDSTKVIHVLDDITIPEGTVLEVQAGTKIKVAPEKNFFINGELVIQGTKSNPVWFTTLDNDKFWGGFITSGSNTSIEYCFFTYAGGDLSHAFGHSQSQPVLYFKESDVTIDNVYLFDNIGKAYASYYSKLSISNTVISRCDTGGEFHYSVTNITDSHVSDLPMPGEYIDDNDGFYFYRPYKETDERSSVKNSYILDGLDDAIDHNGAHLDVINTWISGFKHEGLAGSYFHTAYLENCVIMNCGQGVEAGKGHPNVRVNHCVIINNEVGLRFGDDYEHTCTGNLFVENSIILNNSNNALNYVIHDNGPYPAGIQVNRSIFTDFEQVIIENCFDLNPSFDKQYYLNSNSPGSNLANDGKDLGRNK
jgi:hypothetical protein